MNSVPNRQGDRLCEERPDEFDVVIARSAATWQSRMSGGMDCRASLAMTKPGQ